MGLDMVTPVCYFEIAEGDSPSLKGVRQTAKTKTSTDVKRRYNERVYTRIYLQVPKDTGDAFKAKCKAQGIAQRSVLTEAIENFLRDE